MTETERLAEELRRTREELEQLRRDAAEAARARAALEALLLLPRFALTLYDRDMRFLQVSPGWTARIGARAEKVLGRSLYDVVPWTRSHAEIHQKCLAGEVHGLSHLAVPTVYGERRLNIEFAPWRTPDGEIGGLAVLSDDVTDLVNAREEARGLEQRLALALKISQSLVWEISLKEERLFATGAIEAIFGAAPTYEAFAGDSMGFVHPDDRPQVWAAWAALWKGQAPFRVEHRVCREDGVEVWVDSAAEILRDEQGAPDRVVGVFRNVTGRKHDQIAAARAREAAETANLAKSEFLANMSHEIRTPLNGVLGVAGVLGRTALSPEQRTLVKLIESSAATLERLLSDVLDLARIEQGGFEIHPEVFDLGEMLKGVHALFEPRARDKGLAFELALGEGCDGPYVADGVRLRQIVANLISNAVKFTETGFVRLVAAIEPMTDGGRRLSIVVEDSGIGFDPETAHRLFERFRQADGSITRRYGGSGLGLAISRDLAERMGGSLAARSTPGEGSVFTLVTPLAVTGAAAPTAEPAPPAEEPKPCRPLRVLLAEDHPTNRKVVELILAAASVDLVSVEDGAQAVDAARASRYDLILMDMQMPVMDGLTAIRHIRAHEAAAALRRTPILALTANAMPEHARASRQAGADGHVAKPVSATALLDAVARATAGEATSVCA